MVAQRQYYIPSWTGCCQAFLTAFWIRFVSEESPAQLRTKHNHPVSVRQLVEERERNRRKFVVRDLAAHLLFL